MAGILRIFPRRTSLTPADTWAFVGDPPLLVADEPRSPWIRPRHEQVREIHVSVAFTWDRDEGRRLAGAWAAQYPGVPIRLGGPAFDDRPAGFTPGLYLRPGVTFTTRGCNNHCPWCLVPEREGRLAELADFSPGHVVQDNNLLQASRAHRRRVFAMLAKQRRAAVFAGGLDARWVDDQLAEELRGLRIDSVFLAADVDAAIAPLERALKRLAFLPRRKLRVYVMLGYAGESLACAEARLEAVWELGALPFAQLYQPPDRWIPYSRSWRDLARTWSRPAAMFTLHAHAPSRVVNTRVFTDQR